KDVFHIVGTHRCREPRVVDLAPRVWARRCVQDGVSRPVHRLIVTLIPFLTRRIFTNLALTPFARLARDTGLRFVRFAVFRLVLFIVPPVGLEVSPPLLACSHVCAARASPSLLPPKDPRRS